MIREFALIDVFYLVAAVRWTIALSLVAFLGGGVLGLVLAVLRVSRFAPLRLLAGSYIQVVQGTPLLCLLFVFFFGLSVFGLPVHPWIGATLALSVYAGAFLGEIWRGALQSIARTQWEAGASLGLGFLQQLRYVVLPQAIRVATPPTVGFLVQLIKNTSLAATIGFIELTREGQLTTASTFQPFAVYGTVAMLYFMLCFPLSKLSGRLERKFHVASCELQGFDVDLANMIAEALGVELELVQATAANRIPYLITDKADMNVAAMSVTPERAKQVMYSAPYADTSLAVFGPESLDINSAADLGSNRVSVAKGTTEDITLSAAAPDADIMRTEDNASAVQAYLSGQSDLLAANSVVVVELAKMNPDKEFDYKFALRRAPAHVTVKMGEHNLLRWIDTFIFLSTLDGSLDELHEKWLGGPMTAPLPPL